MIITFGKYKGNDVSDLPTDYLEWGATKLDSPKWRKAFEDELSRRNNLEQEKKEKLKLNIDSSETLEELMKSAFQEIQAEISSSGCEWEYNNFDFQGEAERRASEALKELKAEIAIENLKKEIKEKDKSLTEEVLQKIEDAHYNHGLERSQFSSDLRYQLAVEYMQNLESIRGY